MAIISVPGIAEKLAFKTLIADENFFLFGKTNQELTHLFRSQLVGGPSIVFDRKQIKVIIVN